MNDFETAMSHDDREQLRAIAASEVLSDGKLLSSSIIHNRVNTMVYLVDVCGKARDNRRIGLKMDSSDEHGTTPIETALETGTASQGLTHDREHPRA